MADMVGFERGTERIVWMTKRDRQFYTIEIGIDSDTTEAAYLGTAEKDGKTWKATAPEGQGYEGKTRKDVVGFLLANAEQDIRPMYGYEGNSCPGLENALTNGL